MAVPGIFDLARQGVEPQIRRVQPAANPPEDTKLPVHGSVPMRWIWNGGCPQIDWCELGGLRLTAPFFDQSVCDARQSRPTIRRTPAQILDALSGTAAAPVAGLVFHLSRCGSTLLSQTLAAFPETIVVSESPAFDDALRAELIFPGVTPEVVVQALRRLAAAYGQRRFPAERRLFIKFDTWHVLHFERIKEAFPGVPWVFLYRDPVEILVSQLTEVSGRMLPGVMGAQYLGIPLLEALQSAQEEFCARALGRIAAAGAEALRRDPAGGWAINYSQFPGVLETLLPRWLDQPADGDAREIIRGVARFHSKSPGRAFQADGADKQRLATKAIRELVERWAQPAYRLLEEIRLLPAASARSG